jgi:hypothetical protein
MVLAHPPNTKTEFAIGLHSASLLRGLFGSAFFLDPDALEFLSGLFLFVRLLQRHELAGGSVALGPGGRASSGVLVCERFFTAPLRALSPIGLLTAIVSSP